MRSKKLKLESCKTPLIILAIFLFSATVWSLINGGYLSSLLGQPVEINAIRSKKVCPEGCVGGKYQYYNNKQGCVSKSSPKCGGIGSRPNIVKPSSSPLNTPKDQIIGPNGEYMTSCGWSCPVPDQTPTLAPLRCQDTPNRGKMLWANDEGCGCIKTELRLDTSCPR